MKTKLGTALLTALAVLTIRADVIWPVNAGWTPIYSGGSYYSDTVHDAINPGNDDNHLDIVGDATHAAGFMLYREDAATTTPGITEDQLLVRIRVDGKKNNNSDGVWQVFFDTDAAPGMEWLLELNGTIDRNGNIASTSMLRFTEVLSGGNDLDAITVSTTSQLWTPSGDAASYANFSPTDDNSAFNGDTDYFLDMAIPWSVFSAATFIASTNDAFSVALSSSSMKGYDGVGIDGDIGLITEKTSVTLSDATSDAIPEPLVATLVLGFGMSLLISRRIFQE